MRVRGTYNGGTTNLQISVAKLMLSFISIRHVLLYRYCWGPFERERSYMQLIQICEAVKHKDVLANTCADLLQSDYRSIDQ